MKEKATTSPMAHPFTAREEASFIHTWAPGTKHICKYFMQSSGGSVSVCVRPIAKSGIAFDVTQSIDDTLDCTRCGQGMDFWSVLFCRLFVLLTCCTSVHMLPILVVLFWSPWLLVLCWYLKLLSASPIHAPLPPPPAGP